MSTKKSNDPRYYSMEVMVDDYPQCCGIEIITGMYADVSTYPGGLTKAQLFKDFLKQVNLKRRCRHLQLSFVKRRKGNKEGDMPDGFQQFLEKNGWFKIEEFVNPAHGNRLCVMGKTFRTEKKSNFGF